MSTDEEYELLPHEEVEELRRDVNRLKKNPFGEGKDSQDLIASINDLRHAIETLHALFAQTDQEMVQEYRATSIKDHFRIISQQNEHIAEGIVSVANLLQQLMTTPQPQAVPPESMSESSSTMPQPASTLDQQPPLQRVTPKPTDTITNPSTIATSQATPIPSQAAFEMQQTINNVSSQPASIPSQSQPMNPLLPRQNNTSLPPPLPPPPKRKGLFK